MAFNRVVSAVTKVAAPLVQETDGLSALKTAIGKSLTEFWRRRRAALVIDTTAEFSMLKNQPCSRHPPTKCALLKFTTLSTRVLTF